jgi:precorrin-6Y C5,15-methyltransferase (decarboxylating)
VVGIGEDGLNGLGTAARALIKDAQVLFGGERHLAMLPGSRARCFVWDKLPEDVKAIARLQGKRVCVLASGDPMWFGIGATLARRFTPAEMTVIPHPGAFSLATARLGWPLAETVCVSVHGRPLETISLHLHPGARLLVLAEDEQTPMRLAALLRERGYGRSIMTALERLGGPNERVVAGTAARWRTRRCDLLTTLAVEVVADNTAIVRTRVSGLPDEAYLHDGQISQPEIRAAALAALAPWPGARLWDIGAGAGSIAVEWARAGGRAIAIERVAARRNFIARNAVALGVPQIEIVAGTAPAVLKGLAPPEAIFVGGGTSNPALLAAAWRALHSGGRLVAHAVTAEGEAVLAQFHEKHGGDMIRLAIARLATIGRFHRWDPQAPVTQYKVTKP